MRPRVWWHRQKRNEGSNLTMQEWLRKAVEAVPVPGWFLSLGVSYVLGMVAHDCVYRRYSEGAFWVALLVYILPTLVGSLRCHPNFRLLLLTNTPSGYASDQRLWAAVMLTGCMSDQAPWPSHFLFTGCCVERPGRVKKQESDDERQKRRTWNHRGCRSRPR